MLRRLVHTVLSCFLSLEESWRLLDPRFCRQRQWYARHVWCSSGISLMRVLKRMLCGKNVLAEHIIQEKHVPMWKFKLVDDSRLTQNKLNINVKSKSPKGRSSRCHPEAEKLVSSLPAVTLFLKIDPSFGSSALFPENRSTVVWCVKSQKTHLIVHVVYKWQTFFFYIK